MAEKTEGVPKGTWTLHAVEYGDRVGYHMLTFTGVGNDYVLGREATATELAAWKAAGEKLMAPPATLPSPSRTWSVTRG